MFDNIGGKIKALAKVLCWIDIVASIIVGIVLVIEDFTFAGILMLTLGPLFSWIGSFVLYGFGQLIENSDAAVAYHESELDLRAQQKKDEKLKEKAEAVKAVLNDDSISDDTYIDIICPNCGEKIYFAKSELKENDTVLCPMCDTGISTAQYK